MSVDLQVRDLLRGDPHIPKINFKVPDVPEITGADFRAMASCFSDGMVPHRIRIALGRRFISPSAGAMYSPSEWQYREQPSRLFMRDTISIADESVVSDISRRMPLIHEVTHAIIDAKAIPTSTRDNEAAAFLAGFLYDFNAGVARRAEDARPGASQRVQRNAQAWQEVFDVTQQVHARSNGSSIVQVTQDERRRLRWACNLFGIYSLTYSVTDGIRGYILRNGNWIRR